MWLTDRQTDRESERERENEDNVSKYNRSSKVGHGAVIQNRNNEMCCLITISHH